MPKISRLSGGSDWIELDFVERQRTPEFAMRLGVQMHVAGLSLSNTISILDTVYCKSVPVDRPPVSAIHR
jgi:putative transposase